MFPININQYNCVVETCLLSFIMNIDIYGNVNIDLFLLRIPRQRILVRFNMAANLACLADDR